MTVRGVAFAPPCVVVVAFVASALGACARPAARPTPAPLELRPGKPRVLGRWTALAHCAPPKDERTGRRLFFRVAGGAAIFREQVVTERCFYPPAPPNPR